MQADVPNESSSPVADVATNVQTQSDGEGAELGTYHCNQIKRYTSGIECLPVSAGISATVSGNP